MIAKPQFERINAASREQGRKGRREDPCLEPQRPEFRVIPYRIKRKSFLIQSFRPRGKVYTHENKE